MNNTKAINTYNFIKYCFSSLSKLKKSLLFGIIFIYLLTRFLFIGCNGIFSDEATYCHWAYCVGSSPESWFESLKDGKYPLFIWLIAFSQCFISDPLLAGRTVAILSGVLVILGLFSLGRILFDDRVAFLSSTLYLIFPLSIMQDRMALFDTLLNASLLWGLSLIIWITREEHLNKKSSIALAIICAIAFYIKFTGIQLAFFLLIALMIYIPQKRWKHYFPTILLIFTIISLIYVGFNLIERSLYKEENILSKLGIFFIPIKHLMKLPMWKWSNNYQILYTSFQCYWGLMPLVLISIGFAKWIHMRMWKDTLLIILWCMTPIIFYIFFANIFFPRYLLPCFTPLIIVSVIGFLTVNDFFKKLLMRFCRTSTLYFYTSILIFILFYFPFLKFTMLSFLTPVNTPFAPIDHWQYVSGWPAGTYFKDLLKLIHKKYDKQLCNIILHKHLGLLPDGLPLYLSQNKPYMISYLNLWSLENIQASVKSDRKNLIIIDEFPPSDNAIAFINSAPPYLKLIAELKNPGPEANKCWVFSYEVLKDN